MSLLIDTGAAYAYYDRDDDWHREMLALIHAEEGTLIIPAMVLPEVDHLLGFRIGAAARHAFYDDLVDQVFYVADLEDPGYVRIADLNRRYKDLDLGLVDAAVAATAEQLRITRLATTDRGHFSAIYADVPLQLLPAQFSWGRA